MKNKLINVVKGFFFGIANIIPGVSGGTIAITMGVYEDMIGSISNFFKNPIKSIKYLLPLGIGAALAILLMSKVISFSLARYPFPTVLFFIGLILGGIPLIARKVKNESIKPLYIGLFILTFSIVMIMNFASSSSAEMNLSSIDVATMVKLVVIGMIAAGTMVVPGISGSFVLMLLGAYEPIINVIGDLTNFENLTHNLSVLVPFGIGVVGGIIVIAKVLEYLFDKYEVPTYYAILGFIVSSVIGLATTIFNVKIALIEIVIGIILFALGCIIGYKLGDE